MRNYLVVIFLLSVVFYACEEIEDPANQVSPPMISVDFQADSTRRIVQLLVHDADSVVDKLLTRYNVLVEEEGDTTQAGIDYREAMHVSDSLNEVFDLLKSNRVILDTVFAIYESPNFVVDTVNSVFKLPLDMNSDSCTYVFSYFKLKDTLTFSYNTRVVADKEKISVVAYNIELTKSTFDSFARLYCQNENCTSGEIVYQVFF